MLVESSSRLAPRGNLVIVSDSVHMGSVVRLSLGNSIHSPLRLVHAPLYCPGDLRYICMQSCRFPVKDALIVAYSVRWGL